MSDTIRRAKARMGACSPEGPIVEAYIALLKLPLGSLARINADPILAKLRDLIAEMSDDDPEFVQEWFEYVAGQ